MLRKLCLSLAMITGLLKSTRGNTKGKALNNRLLRCGMALSATLFSVLALAQSFPLFGVARFGRTQFGPLPEPVPALPLWALILTAIALWAVVYTMKTKTTQGD